MSDYARLQEENTALKAENDRLKAEASVKKPEPVDAEKPKAKSHK